MMKKNKIISVILISSIVILALSACGLTTSGGETKQRTTLAETVFEVALPAALNEGELLYLEILDEVTGTALNPTRYEMEAKDNLSYYVRIPMTKGSVVKYRYIRHGAGDIIEHDAGGNQLQYRINVIKKAAVISDFIASWDSNGFFGTVGEISGYVYDADSEAPLSEMMIFLNGQRTTTTSDGFFELRNIPTGEYNLVAMHPDGKYQIFQQGAVIAENSVTPASFGMQTADMVDVTFVVTPPENEATIGEMRFISNLYSLGNTYSENDGSVSVLASQAPVMELQNNGTYTLTLELPEGFDLRYKFSLGDGFINAEHAEDSSYNVRQLIVPGKKSKIKNKIYSWYSTGSQPVTFNLTVPENTPANDVASIQFNPFVWMESIPMQQVSQTEWTFTLYSPQEYLHGAQFRFCRNYQCGLADDSLTSGKDASGYLLDLSDPSIQEVDYVLTDWTGLSASQYAFNPISIPADNSIYIKGIEVDHRFNKKDFATYEWGLVDAAVNGTNMLLLSPTWTFPDSVGDVIRIKPGTDLMTVDIDTIDAYASEAGVALGLYPQPNFNEYSSHVDYWNNTATSYSWWEDWFEKYERFMLHYASYAEANGIQTLVVGGSRVSPAFPNGKLPNGNPSITPYTFDANWSTLIDEIRAVFSGQLFFALPYSSEMADMPDFVGKADAVYVEFSSALVSSHLASTDEIKSGAASILDSQVYKLYAKYQKPVILGINYAAIDGSAANCSNFSSSCLYYIDVQGTAFDYVDLEEQARIYQALMEEAIQRSWIYGLISQGYNPSVAVEDNSSSIYGKPAATVVAHYFNSIVR
jgi:hypothetical protein